MDRDLALQLIELLDDIKDALTDINTACETIATNTTPADDGGDETPPADGGGGDAVPAEG